MTGDALADSKNLLDLLVKITQKQVNFMSDCNDLKVKIDAQKGTSATDAPHPPLYVLWTRSPASEDHLFEVRKLAEKERFFFEKEPVDFTIFEGESG